MNLPAALDAVAWVTGALALAGVAQAGAGHGVVRRFLQTAPSEPPASLPPVSVLKPLHGDEPMLEEALASFCTQDYPSLQVVFGVQNPDDPAIAVVERLQARFPSADLTLVVDPSPHGANRKVDNLINMRPHCRHAVLVISDADVHATPGLIRDVVARLSGPGVGLATTLYAGRAASSSLCRLLGATQINQLFLPGALLGRALGRKDCLGAVMALTADTLDRIGGFATLSPHLADDAVLGRKVQGLGLEVAFARSVPSTGVVERSLGELFSHELRWGRTVRSQAPVGYPMSILQAPIVWAALSVAASGASAASLALFALVWAARHLLGRDLERRLAIGIASPFWLAPLRDALSFAVIVASHFGGEVAWRGQTLHVSALENMRRHAPPPVRRPIEPWVRDGRVTTTGWRAGNRVTRIGSETEPV